MTHNTMSTVKKTNIKLGKHCSSFCGEGLISLGHKSSEKSIRINNNKKSIRINREREPTPNSSQEELRVTSSAWQMVDLAQERRAREINAEGTRERLTGEFLSLLRLGTARMHTVSIAQASRGRGESEAAGGEARSGKRRRGGPVEAGPRLSLTALNSQVDVTTTLQVAISSLCPPLSQCFKKPNTP